MASPITVPTSLGRKLTAMAVGLILLLGAVACAEESEPGSDAAADEEPEPVILALATCSTYYYHIHIAEELGFFEDEGLDVTKECVDGSSAVVQQLQAGNADIGGVGMAAMLPTFEQDSPLYPFMIHLYGLAYELSVPTDSEIQTIAELEGKKIGVSALAGAETPVIKALLADAGVDPDKGVEFVEVGADPALVRLSLDRGRIEAIGSTVSDAGVLDNSGIEIRSLIPDDLRETLSQLPSGGLVATEELKDKTDILGALGRADAKGFIVAYTNPEAALCILADVIPEDFIDPDAGRGGFESTLEFTTAPQGADGNYSFTAGIDDVQLWNDFVELYAAGGVLSEPFDMEPYLIDVQDEIHDFDQAEVIEFAEGLDSDC